MATTKPYYRIARSSDLYISDSRYAPDRSALTHAFKLIENDLKRVFEFVDPSDDNKNAYSHRLYELLLRSATELETNCKQILISNGYNQRDIRYWNICDYYKINDATHLSEYKVKLNIWHPEALELTPFEGWASNHELTWYQDYNLVKHDRFNNFQKASMINVLNATASVLSILYAQFRDHSLLNQDVVIHSSYDHDDGYTYSPDLVFSIKPFNDWDENERYNFNWDQLSRSTDPFQQYSF